MLIKKQPFYHRSIILKDDCMQLSEQLQVCYTMGKNCKTSIDVTIYEQCEDEQLFETEYCNGKYSHLFMSEPGIV